ncbi:MAG: hypothetical protein KAQ74_06490, partial [Dehalococcoidia bacterium]|nr:hypothetical protein [Dehalococcoidia bacterium]
MKHKILSDLSVGLLVSTVVAAMSSLIQNTDWLFAICLGAATAIVFALRLAHPKIASSKHKRVITRVELEIRSLHIDRTNETVCFVVRILNTSNMRLKLRSITKPKIRFDHSTPVLTNVQITSDD